LSYPQHVKVVTDNNRTAGAEIPKRHHEDKIVKKLKNVGSSLQAACGKAFKMVSQRLHDLPVTKIYGLVLMERDWDATSRSQEEMFQRLARPAGSGDLMKRNRALHLKHLLECLAR
jgi:hypothetical protein